METKEQPFGLYEGQRAEKYGGSFQATGVIVSCFYTTAHEPRYVFEFDQPKGMLHIYTPAQLRAVTE